MNLDEVTGGLLDEALADGLVRRQRHPELPLTIYNYTERAVYEREWNTASRSCRGLIANDEGVGCVKIDGEVWTARSLDDDRVIEKGTRVDVIQIKGATALVSE